MHTGPRKPNMYDILKLLFYNYVYNNKVIDI